MPYAPERPADYGSLYDEAYYRNRGMRWLFDDPYNDTHFRQFLEKLEAAAPCPPASAILDLGCGIGHRAYHLARRGARVDAVDISPFAVEYARRTYAHPGAAFHEADILTWDTRERYDLVLLVSIYEHLAEEDQDALLERIKGWLKPGGRVCPHVAIGESFLGRRKSARKPTGTIDFTGDPTHLHSFDVPTLYAHFARHGFRLAGEYRRNGSFVLSGKLLERLMRWCRLPAAWRDALVVELLPAFVVT